MKRVLIIAEAGVNHNGNIGLAKKMIVVAKEAGADMIKFQTAVPELGITESTPKTAYQKETTGRGESQLEMAKKIHLPLSAFKGLKKYAERQGILFLSTPFDLKSIDALKKLNLKCYKIPSGEITNLPYLRKIGKLRKKVIMSTGMATMKEIEKALDILIKEGTKKKNITVLHCNTEYPTPHGDVNLLAMLAIRDRLGVRVGYSDHTQGIEIAVAAVSLGASVIEKHFTLDKNMAGPDHKASLEPHELKAMVRAIRNIEKALGNGIKKPSKSEIKNIPLVRKSIVALRDIKKGERFTESNIAAKRPGTGLSPMFWDKVIGAIARMDFHRDEAISL